MFDFDRPEDGSQERYSARLAVNAHPASRIRHLGWWVLHNAVAHPCIGLAPFRWSFEFHDWTSRRLNAVPSEGKTEVQK